MLILALVSMLKSWTVSLSYQSPSPGLTEMILSYTKAVATNCSFSDSGIYQYMKYMQIRSKGSVQRKYLNHTTRVISALITSNKLLKLKIVSRDKLI